MKNLLGKTILTGIILIYATSVLAAKPGLNQVPSKNDSMQFKMDALQQKLDAIQKQMDQKEKEMDDLSRQLDSMSDKIVLNDSTVIKLGNMKIDLSDKNNSNKKDIKINSCSGSSCKHKIFETKWGGLDLGINSFMSDNQLKTPTGYPDLQLVNVPVVVNIHVFRSQINMFKAHLNFNYGISFELNNYKFTSNNYLAPNTDSVSFIESGLNLKKNKLADTYVELPVMLEFVSNPSNPDKSFHVGVGGSAGYLVNAHTKRLLPDGGKIKEHDDFNLNKMRYGMTGTIGFGKVTFFANYSISDFFSNSLMPRMNAVSAGIVLIGFDD